jgi:hypothetical protein
VEAMAGTLWSIWERPKSSESPKQPETTENERPPMGPGSWVELKAMNRQNVQTRGQKS